MIAKVVDTNVPIAANRRNTHIDPKCQLACIQALDDIVKNGYVVIDKLGLIMKEYRENLNFKGEPGVGDGFYKYIFDNQYNTKKCLIVTITPKNDGSGSFEEFPNSIALNGFDLSDHKFVAVASACDSDPSILNASDSDWSDYEDALNDCDIVVEQLCPQHAKK